METKEIIQKMHSILYFNESQEVQNNRVEFSISVYKKHGRTELELIQKYIKELESRYQQDLIDLLATFHHTMDDVKYEQRDITGKLYYVQLKNSYLTNHQSERPWEEWPNPNLWY